MDYIYKSWVIQIDITNLCKKHCIYCTRYLGHLPSKKRYTMTLDRFSEIIDSLEGWPNVVGIMGGEPLLHPQFKEFIALAAQRIPKERLRLWTSGIPGTILENPRLVADIADKFGYIYYNPHNAVQLSSCRHQPLTIAIDEVVQDKGIMWKLINNCWLPSRWAPSIVAAGAYFCEVAGPLDAILYDGKHALKIEQDWWKRPPEAFQEQISMLCTQCGMCLPMKRQLLEDTQELFTPRLAQNFRNAGAIRMDSENIKIFDKQFTNIEIFNAMKNWYPANYRNDICADETLQEWEKGITIDINSQKVKNVFNLDTEDDFKLALSKINQISSTNNVPSEYSFIYKDLTFNPLREPYPFVLDGYKKENILYFRAMLLHFRQILDDNEFDALKNTECTPKLLRELAHKYRLLIQEYFKKQAIQLGLDLSGKKVYFWGYGTTWKYYSSYFSQVYPQCFLVDRPDLIVQKDVDGIPIMSPDKLINEGAPALPSIMFTREQFADWSNNITSRYSELIEGSLHKVLLGHFNLL